MQPSRNHLGVYFLGNNALQRHIIHIVKIELLGWVGVEREEKTLLGWSMK